MLHVIGWIYKDSCYTLYYLQYEFTVVQAWCLVIYETTMEMNAAYEISWVPF